MARGLLERQRVKWVLLSAALLAWFPGCQPEGEEPRRFDRGRRRIVDVDQSADDFRVRETGYTETRSSVSVSSRDEPAERRRSGFRQLRW
jgi:hypothetical protein